MGVLGSVKNRIKTMFIINKNRKKKKNIEKQTKTENKKVLVSVKQNKLSIPIIETKIVKPKRTETTLKHKPIVKNKIIIQQPILKKETEVSKIENSNNKYVEKVISKPKSKKIHSKKNDKIKNIKSCNEETKIVERVDLFLSDARKQIKKIKLQLEKQETKLKNIKTKEDIEKEKVELEKIHHKIDELNSILNKIISQYDFKYYDELNDKLLFEYIDNYKFKNDFNMVDNLVEKCKLEAKKVDELTSLTIKIRNLQKIKDDKKDKIDYLEYEYNFKVVDIQKLSAKEDTIKRYLDKENDYLKKLSVEVCDTTVDKIKTSRLAFNKGYINNLFNLGIGINCFQTTFVGAFIGAFILKGATSNLLKGAFKKEFYTEYFYLYHEYTSKIQTNLDLVEETLYLANDSLDDIVKIKKNMEADYKEYLKNPKYQDIYNKIVLMEQTLLKKIEKTYVIREALKQNEKKNNEKQIKLEEYNHK